MKLEEIKKEKAVQDMLGLQIKSFKKIRRACLDQESKTEIRSIIKIFLWLGDRLDQGEIQN